MRTAKAVFKLALFGLWIVILAPPQMLVLLFDKGPRSYTIPLFFHKSMCAVFGIRYTISGKPDLSRQVLFMSNHLSYLDIILLGSVLPAAFLAKKEVASWPIFGMLAWLQQCAYIERKRAAITEAHKALDEFLASGRSLVIFPEGTSSSGMEVLPFKSSLFTLAQKSSSPLAVQPVTIALTRVDRRRPQNRDEFNIYAWPLEMETSLPVHLWQFAKTSGAHFHLVFHDPIFPAPEEDRKTLAKACHESVSKGLQAALAA